ncbi:hypothetical protein [Glycomyces sp. NPDC048151]|uniref:hypothetical protein n=1 Tax=Glycomyces sp. NPDC048151 TaxID=3364002 RepID=UPI0037130B98
MSDTKPLNNLRAAAEKERDAMAAQIERIGAGLWQILATTITAAQTNPGELTLISRAQTAASMYETWVAVVDGDDRG